MASVCPSCGNLEFDPSRQCICGYHADEIFLDRSSENKITGPNKNERGTITMRETAKKGKDSSPARQVIKEIDSWVFSYSGGDQCICLGTPALQSFNLMLSVDVLEELLEFMYSHAGSEKTLRKRYLPEDDIPDLVQLIHHLIEEKRSKIPITFDSNELKKITGLINDKLKT